MGKIVEFFLHRPLLVNLIVIAVIGLGIKSAFESKKEGFPEISMNIVNIRTIYPGASAKDVELNVTVPIEDALGEVEGIQEIKSISEEGISAITVYADDNASDREFQELYTEIDNALSKVNDLPGDIDSMPSISKFSSKDVPVLEVAFFGPYENLKTFIPFIETKIKKVDGVAAVDVIGLPDDEVQILVDPVMARKHMIGLGNIAMAIKKRNLEGTGGTLESFIGEKKIVSYNKFQKYEDVLDTNIVMSVDGYGVKLKDIAKIEVLPEDVNLLVRNNGKRGVYITVKKKANKDIIKTVDKIKEVLKNAHRSENIKYMVLFDQSEFTSTRLKILQSNALLGFVLVTALLFLIFNIKTAFWTAFGIPFSLLIVMIFLKQSNISLNLISLGGFILVIGMLVDDAIVISEEINSNKEKGMEPKKAAIEAVKKMWVPVTGACLTTMIAFSPILAFGGLPGKFVWVMPLMVIVALTASLFESFFVLPAHLYHGKSYKPVKKPFIIKAEKIYRSLLTKALNKKYFVLLFMILILLASLLTMKNFVKKIPFPQEASEGFLVKATLPKGTNLNKTLKEIKIIEKIIMDLPKNEFKGISTRIGTQNELSSTDRGTQNNIAIIFVFLTEYSERNKTAEMIMEGLRKPLDNAISRNTKYSLILRRIGPPIGRDFEIRITSNDDELRYGKEKEIKEFLSTIKGVHDVDNNETEGKDEWNLNINHDILSQTGLTVEDVLMTLRIAFDGQVITDMTNLSKEVNFRLRLNKKGRADRKFINNLPIMNKQGNLINLKEFINMEERPSTAAIHHIDAKRTLTIFGNTDIKIITPVEVTDKIKKKFHSSEKVEVSFSGLSVETNKIFGDVGGAAAIAVLGVFLIISLIFNSFKKPFIVITIIPFGIVGIVFSLITHNLPASMFSGIAMVGLIGVIVNDSIVMVHTITDRAKSKGITKKVIIDGAVSRLRPIILTTLTTVLGVLPTGYGIGGYDPFLSQMCISIAYGLLFGTIILIFFVPITYAIGIDIENTIDRVRFNMGRPAKSKGK